MKVSLNKISEVNKFVDAMMRCPIEADLISGRYVIDAKSVMGIFSLDLSKPIDIVFHGRMSDEDFKRIEEFIIE